MNLNRDLLTHSDHIRRSKIGFHSKRHFDYSHFNKKQFLKITFLNTSRTFDLQAFENGKFHAFSNRQKNQKLSLKIY